MSSARRLIASLVPALAPAQVPTVDFAALHEIGDRAYQEDVCDWHIEALHAFWVVCDGAGGHGGGATAARMAADASLRAWRARPVASTANLAAIIEAANQAVLLGQRQTLAHQHMRTTIALLAVDLQEGVLAWGHSGDSRIYAHGAPDDLVVSRDHSLVRDLLEAGLVDGDASRQHPRRNILTAALGNHNTEVQLAQHVFRRQQVASFLLCTDGFWEPVEDDQIGAVLRRHALPAADAMGGLQHLIQQQAPAGRDNCTGVLVYVRGS